MVKSPPRAPIASIVDRRSGAQGKVPRLIDVDNPGQASEPRGRLTVMTLFVMVGAQVPVMR